MMKVSRELEFGLAFQRPRRGRRECDSEPAEKRDGTLNSLEGPDHRELTGKRNRVCRDKSSR